MSQIPDSLAPVPDPPEPSELPRIGKTQKTINVVLWGLVGVVLIGMLVGKFTRSRHAILPVLFQTPAFALTDQEGKPFSNVDLRGKPYVCDFIFTTCGSACPMMSQKLANVQKQTQGEVQLVSFTVNPEHDTPAVLKGYSVLYGADLSRWHFLTGMPAQMATTVREMKLAVTPATEHDPIGHSEKFLLVDGDGNVRGIYDSNDEKSMQNLVADAASLANSPNARGW